MLRDSATCQENYRRFVQRVVVAGEAWILSSNNGAASCESNHHDDADVILFFSDAAYARRAQSQSFPDHEPERMDLFDLLYRWLPGMSQDGVLAGPNWTGDLVELEFDPFKLREELESQLSAEQRTRFAERYRQAKELEDNGRSV